MSGNMENVDAQINDPTVCAKAPVVEEKKIEEPAADLTEATDLTEPKTVDATPEDKEDKKLEDKLADPDDEEPAESDAGSSQHDLGNVLRDEQVVKALWQMSKASQKKQANATIEKLEKAASNLSDPSVPMPDDDEHVRLVSDGTLFVDDSSTLGIEIDKTQIKLSNYYASKKRFDPVRIAFAKYMAAHKVRSSCDPLLDDFMKAKAAADAAAEAEIQAMEAALEAKKTALAAARGS